MVLAGVSWEGKTNIHFIDTPRSKFNSKSYIQLLDDNLLLNCRRLYLRNNYVFHQGGAPPQTSRVTQAHLEEVSPDFIKKYEWPPQSSDCNPMDYIKWDSLKDKVYRAVQDKLTEQALVNKIMISRGKYR